MELKVYHCSICGNILTPLHDSKVVPFCCGQKMTIMTVNTVDASKEKHVPVVEIKDNIVNIQVGAVLHPSIEAHYIEFIILVSDKGSHIKYLKPGQEPTAKFVLKDEVPLAVYEYCNLHGLWKVAVK